MDADAARRLHEAVTAFFGDGEFRARRGAREEANAALLSALEADLGVRLDRRGDRRHGQYDRGVLAVGPDAAPLDPPRFPDAAAEAERLAREGGLRHDLYLDLSDVAPCARLTGNTRTLDGGRVRAAFFFADAAPKAALPWVVRIRRFLRERDVPLPDEAFLATEVRPTAGYPELDDAPADYLTHLFGEV